MSKRSQNTEISAKSSKQSKMEESKLSETLAKGVLKFLPEGEQQKAAGISKTFLNASRQVAPNPFYELHMLDCAVLDFSGRSLSKEETSNIMKVLKENEIRSKSIRKLLFKNCNLYQLDDLKDVIVSGNLCNLDLLDLSFNNLRTSPSHDEVSVFDHVIAAAKIARKEGKFKAQILSTQAPGCGYNCFTDICRLSYKYDAPYYPGEFFEPVNAFRHLHGELNDLIDPLRIISKEFSSDIVQIPDEGYDEDWSKFCVIVEVKDPSVEDERLVLNLEQKTAKLKVKYIVNWRSQEFNEYEITADIIPEVPEPQLAPVMGNPDGRIFLKYGMVCHGDHSWEFSTIISPPILSIWEAYQTQMVYEGVDYSDSLLTPERRESLMKNIDKFIATKSVKDFHPGTNDTVHDIVHPAIYSYVKGQSQFKSNYEPQEKRRVGIFGRQYEDSDYQWLPSIFNINQSGKVKIETYINNLPKTPENQELYSVLEHLFQDFLPMFRNALSYCSKLDYEKVEEDFSMFFSFGGQNREQEPPKEKTPPVSARAESLINMKCQVITKIVDYELQPGASFEGVWHVEGMSHENIISTGLCILDRDDDIVGGELEFKRAITVPEGEDIRMGVAQLRSRFIDDLVQKGLTPLGTLETSNHRMIVFPNSHVHRVKKMYNKSTKTARRRIVVFFLVNPDTEIISTNDIDPQQNQISWSQALINREKLMVERKRHKQDFNIREIELCEH